MVLPRPGAFLYRYRRHNTPSDEQMRSDLLLAGGRNVAQRGLDRIG